MELQFAVPDQPGASALPALTVSSDVFDREYNEPLVHQVVTAYLSAARQGSHKQKTRAEVRGGGRKPHKQKGTGHARAGSIRSPLWRTGGKIFAAVPQDYSQKVNKKMYRAALQVILSELNRQGRLVLIDTMVLETHKAKDLIAKLVAMGVYDANILIVTGEVDENLYLASRNLTTVYVQDGVTVDPVSLVSFDKVIFTVEAIKQLEERLA